MTTFTQDTINNPFNTSNPSNQDTNNTSNTFNQETSNTFNQETSNTSNTFNQETNNTFNQETSNTFNQETSNTFNREKDQILTELNKHNKKLLFPTSVISSMKKQKLVIYSFMKKYNNFLTKIKSLSFKLINLENWGLFIDSHTNWKFSVYRNITGLNVYFQEIIKYINESDDILINIIKNQCGLKLEKIFIFMTCIKEDDKYIWINTNKNTQLELSETYIIDLLPRCITVIDGELKLEEVHKIT